MLISEARRSLISRRWRKQHGYGGSGSLSQFKPPQWNSAYPFTERIHGR